MLGLKKGQTVRYIKKKRVRRKLPYFRFAAVLLAVVTAGMLVYLPTKTVSSEEQQRKLESAMDAYWRAQAENNRLRTLLRESSTEDFVKRVARRDYGYCLYGETIYEVANLDEAMPKAPFDVYQAAAEEEGGV